jgi:hypothetical protein
MKFRAITMVYKGNPPRKQKEGEVFDLSDPKEISLFTMVPVDEEAKKAFEDLKKKVDPKELKEKESMIINPVRSVHLKEGERVPGTLRTKGVRHKNPLVDE